MEYGGQAAGTQSGVRDKYPGLIMLSLFFLMLLLFFADIFFGSLHLPVARVWKALLGSGDATASVIVLKFRLPKAVTAVLAGVALSVSGLQMQTIFRNPMAGPYVLGVSSGASLGVALVILGFSSVMGGNIGGTAGSWLIIAAACCGAGLIMLLVTWLAVRVKDILTVLILGIMIGGGISAIVTIMQYFTSEAMLRSYVIWTMGSLSNLTGSQLTVLAIAMAAGLLPGIASIKVLNLFQLGETYAATSGANVKSGRTIIFISTSILAGGITAFCGPIGFLGIAVPHIARMLFRTSDHRILMPASMLAGASLMLLSDIISQLPGTDKVLPINAITSLLGIPVVIWVIFRGRVIRYQR